MKYLKLSFLIILYCLLPSCDSTAPKNSDSSLTASFFEGEITISESRGLYGRLFKIHTSYWISEDIFRREQRMGGVNSVFNRSAGIVINLNKDSVILYYSDLTNKIKHVLTVEDYKARLSESMFPLKTPSPIDGTFNFLAEYKAKKMVKDSVNIKGFEADYSLYIEDIFQQEVFDTKEIKVKRELLEIVFVNLPQETNFPLQSEFKTIISRIKNDSIINSKQVSLLDKISKDIFYEIDSTNSKEATDLEELSQNKFLNLGLDVFKKGVDLKIHVEGKITEIIEREIDENEMVLPSESFRDVDDFDEFFNLIPSGGEFDD